MGTAVSPCPVHGRHPVVIMAFTRKSGDGDRSATHMSTPPTRASRISPTASRSGSKVLMAWKVYCDLDGVLADFDASVMERTGKHPREWSASELWERVVASPSFWADLAWIGEGRTIWQYLRRHSPTILTGLPHGDKQQRQAIKGKTKWCLQHLGKGVPVITCSSRLKHHHSRSGALLIDDTAELEAAWVAKGGTFVLHRAGHAEDTVRKIKAVLAVPPVTTSSEVLLPAVLPRLTAEMLKGTKPTLAALFLTDEARARLLERFPPRHANVHADHCTLAPAPTRAICEALPTGARYTLLIMREAFDKHGHALSVRLPPELEALCCNVNPHITVSTATGVTPKYSNSMLTVVTPPDFDQCEVVEVEAVVGIQVRPLHGGLTVITDAEVWRSTLCSESLTEATGGRSGETGGEAPERHRHVLRTVKQLRGGTPLESLCKSHRLSAKYHPHHPVVQLSYSQRESDMANAIVQECRGLILDARTFEVVSWPFEKFFNADEPNGAKVRRNFDWSTAKVFEKCDGSLMTLYWYGGSWNVASSSLPAADGQLPFGDEENFADLFWRAFAAAGYTLPSDKKACFMFELTLPQNTIVVRHQQADLVCIGARDLVTLEELDCEIVSQREGWATPRRFSFSSLAAVQAAAQALNPVEQEGFVCVDSAWRRMKVKSPAYVALHHMGPMAGEQIKRDLKPLSEEDERMRSRRLLEIARSREGDEFLGCAHCGSNLPTLTLLGDG